MWPNPQLSPCKNFPLQNEKKVTSVVNAFHIYWSWYLNLNTIKAEPIFWSIWKSHNLHPDLQVDHYKQPNFWHLCWSLSIKNFCQIFQYLKTSLCLTEFSPIIKFNWIFPNSLRTLSLQKMAIIAALSAGYYISYHL